MDVNPTCSLSPASENCLNMLRITHIQPVMLISTNPLSTFHVNCIQNMEFAANGMLGMSL